MNDDEKKLTYDQIRLAIMDNNPQHNWKTKKDLEKKIIENPIVAAIIKKKKKKE